MNESTMKDIWGNELVWCTGARRAVTRTSPCTHPGAVHVPLYVPDDCPKSDTKEDS